MNRLNDDGTLQSKMINHFYSRAERFQPNQVQRMAWINKESQHARFEILLESGFKEDNTIYDVGCGVGALYGFLLNHGFSGQYKGCDLVAKNCKDAESVYEQSLFECGNYIDINLVHNYDYIFASGIFFLDSDDWESTLRNTIQKMYEESNVAVVINFLSDRTKLPKLNHQKFCNPNEIINLCDDFVDRYIVRHDYSTQENKFEQQDFTIILLH